MKIILSSRRSFLEHACLTTGMFLVGARSASALERRTSTVLHLASNQYSWTVFYGRENRDFNESLDSGLKDVAASGINGFEPLVTSAQQIDELTPVLRKNGLEVRSLYVNSSLHITDEADRSIDHIVAIAQKAKQVGTQIIVTNPNPIRWGGPEVKNDAQLEVQASALDRLGQKLSDLGLKLAYHNHDIELRNAAREFHHMMVGTNPEYVSLCLDSHWIYRGSGNSTVALSDIVKLYGLRVSELHLRQSINGVWSETFGEGDIHYSWVAQHLLNIGVKPHLVLEQAVEEGTPKTMDPVEAHRKSCEYARRVFAGFAGKSYSGGTMKNTFKKAAQLFEEINKHMEAAF